MLLKESPQALRIMDYGVVHTQADVELVCCKDFILLRCLVLAAVMDKQS